MLEKVKNNKINIIITAFILIASIIVTLNNTDIVYADADTITCKAGEYYDGFNCDTCPAGFYCPGGEFYIEEGQYGLKKCPYSVNSPIGSDDKSDCDQFITCPAGEYPDVLGNCTTCPAGYYCPGGNLHVGVGENGLNKCPSGYTSEEGTSSISYCKSGGGMEVCNNPDILKVIYFFLLIVDIIKIIIPIALIVLGIIDFSKAVISNDEKTQKKSGQLFMKRVLYATLVFTVPWMVEVIMVTLGNVLGKPGTTNFTDCIENANADKIEQIEQEQKLKQELEEELEQGYKCYVCNTNDTIRKWTNKTPSYDSYNYECPAGWREKNYTKDKCSVSGNSGTNSNDETKQCYQCNQNGNIYYWGESNPGANGSCPSGWHTITRTKEECKQ